MSSSVGVWGKEGRFELSTLSEFRHRESNALTCSVSSYRVGSFAQREPMHPWLVLLRAPCVDRIQPAPRWSLESAARVPYC